MLVVTFPQWDNRLTPLYSYHNSTYPSSCVSEPPLILSTTAEIRQTDKQTNRQTDKQMDSFDALSRSRYRERRLKNFNTLPIHDLHAMQLQVFVYKFVYHRDLLPAVFHDYFCQSNAMHGLCPWLWDGTPLNSPKRPPYWNSTSGFDFDHITAVDMSFCTSLWSFIQMEKPSAEKNDVMSIFKMADLSHLGFYGSNNGCFEKPNTTY